MSCPDTMTPHRKFLILIVGPTAVGKTDLCVRLARAFGTEIISCDSRQFYRELSIGTAKPTHEEMGGIKHHFIDSHSISEYYSAGDFGRDVSRLLPEIFKIQDAIIMTGGSGLFIRAVTHGLDDMPEAPLELRDELMKKLAAEGLPALQKQLAELDPLYFHSADIQNTQRVVRALEVCLSTGKPFSSFHRAEETSKDYDIIKIGLERPREELYDRINYRMDQMLEQGLTDEARRLLPFRDHNALQTVGYKEVFGYLDGEYDHHTMAELLKRNSRRYAKRQMTWFRHQDAFTWFHPDSETEIKQFIIEKMAENSGAFGT